MATHRPTGWNTWDFRGFNRLVYLRNGKLRIAVVYALWDESTGKLHDAFRWKDCQRPGPHAPLGLPAQLDLIVDEASFRATATVENDRIQVVVEPQGLARMRVVFMLIVPDGEMLRARSETSGVFAGWQLDLRGATFPSRYFLNIAHPYAVGEPGQPATLTIAPLRPTAQPAAANRSPAIPAEPAELIRRYENEALTGGGALSDAPQAMMRALTWNTLFDPRRRLISTPPSRDWCIDWRGPMVPGWDTFFVAIMASYESRELARANIEAVTESIPRLGFVPNYVMSHGATSLDRSMPPLGAYAVWKIEQPEPDLDWLRRIYPRLRRWHRFWMSNRDGNGDGLLEWGTNPTPRYEFPELLPFNPSLQHTAKCALYESGLDNSPMYDDVPFNAAAHTLELADVGLNSYYALDCEALAAIADVLGKPAHAALYRRQYEAIKRRINDILWDERHGIYANRHWDGRFSARWSPTSFFPLIAGVPAADRAERLVREHLLNDAEFRGDYVIPSIARNDPAFADNDYWRGRIWGPFNFLVAEGLRRYRIDDVATELAGRSLAIFLRNWRHDGGVYENYNATTGAGGDVWNAARLYHWGGLLAFIALQELIDVEPPGFLRFGSVNFPAASLRNARVAGHVYDAEINASVSVRRDGTPFLHCTPRAIIRLPLHAAPQQPIEVTAAAPGRLMLHSWGHPSCPVRLNGKRLVQPVPAGDAVTYTWS